MATKFSALSAVTRSYTKVVQSYPLLCIGISGFTTFYLFRSFKTYQIQKRKKTAHNRLYVRLINNALCISSIVSFFLSPIVIAITPKIQPLHILIWSTLQVPYWRGIDYFTSSINAAEHNYKSMRANGYSPLRIALYSWLNSNVIFFSFYFVIHTLKLNGFNEYKKSANLTLIPKIIANILISDTLFYGIHRWLHLNKKAAIIHQMHHACFTSAIGTSLSFNPIDIIVEFAIGIYPTVIITYLITKDKLSALLSIAIMGAWYHSSHDENLQLFHATKHHAYCLGHFPVYFDKKESLKNDEVRRILAKGYGFRKSKELIN